LDLGQRLQQLQQSPMSRLGAGDTQCCRCCDTD
jgi:hypothetical protein